MHYSKWKGSSQHDSINEKKRQRDKLAYHHIKGSAKYKFLVIMRKGKTSFNKCVHKFKALIKSGPVIFCVV